MKKSAFTLVELLIALVVAVLIIGGVLVSLIYSIILNEYNEKFSIAMNIARAKMEETLSKDFNDIVDESDDLLVSEGAALDGSWQIVVTPLAGNDLKNIRVAVCWEGRGGRVIGGDKNLDGTVDSGTDQVDANGGFISPCVLETAKADR